MIIMMMMVMIGLLTRTVTGCWSSAADAGHWLLPLLHEVCPSIYVYKSASSVRLIHAASASLIQLPTHLSSSSAFVPSAIFSFPIRVPRHHFYFYDSSFSPLAFLLHIFSLSPLLLSCCHDIFFIRLLLLSPSLSLSLLSLSLSLSLSRSHSV